VFLESRQFHVPLAANVGIPTAGGLHEPQFASLRFVLLTPPDRQRHRNDVLKRAGPIPIQLRLPERHHVSSFSAILSEVIGRQIRNELDGFTSHLRRARQRRKR
jgi:hypothetical protein